MYGNNRTKRNELKEELSVLELLEEDGSLLPKQCVRKNLIQNELHLLYAEEELQWFQKSHQRWLLQGDQNTSYFHRVANGRRRKK